MEENFVGEKWRSMQAWLNTSSGGRSEGRFMAGHRQMLQQPATGIDGDLGGGRKAWTSARCIPRVFGSSPGGMLADVGFMADVDVLVCIHGAACVNGFFMPNGSSLVRSRCACASTAMMGLLLPLHVNHLLDY